MPSPAQIEFWCSADPARAWSVAHLPAPRPLAIELRYSVPRMRFSFRALPGLAGSVEPKALHLPRSFRRPNALQEPLIAWDDGRIARNILPLAVAVGELRRGAGAGGVVEMGNHPTDFALADLQPRPIRRYQATAAADWARLRLAAMARGLRAYAAGVFDDIDLLEMAVEAQPDGHLAAPLAPLLWHEVQNSSGLRNECVHIARGHMGFYAHVASNNPRELDLAVLRAAEPFGDLADGAWPVNYRSSQPDAVIQRLFLAEDPKHLPMTREAAMRIAREPKASCRLLAESNNPDAAIGDLAHLYEVGNQLLRHGRRISGLQLLQSIGLIGKGAAPTRQVVAPRRAQRAA